MWYYTNLCTFTVDTVYLLQVHVPRCAVAVEHLARKYRQLMRWRMSPMTPIVVKQCIARAGFRTTTSKCRFLLLCRDCSLYYWHMSRIWLGGLLVERRTSVSQIRSSIPGPVAAE